MVEHSDPADQDAAHVCVGYGSHTYDVGWPCPPDLLSLIWIVFVWGKRNHAAM